MRDTKAMALRKDLLSIGRDGLQRAARAARSGNRGWAGRAERTAEQLSALSAALLRASPGANPSFGNGCAEALGAMAKAATPLPKADDDELVDAAIAAAGALDGLGSLAVQAAQSLRRAPPGVAAEGCAQAAEAAAKAIDQAGALNLLCAQLGWKLREAAGIAVLPARFQVAYPRAMGCGCCGSAPPPMPDSPAVAVEAGAPAAPDRGRLRRAFSQLEELLISLALLLALLAGWMAIQLAYFDEYWYAACDDDCTFPGRPAPVLAGVGFIKVGMGTLQPTVTVQWDFCCRNWCMVVWWETFIRSASVTVNAGPLVNGPRQALAQARNRAAGIIAAMAAPANPC